MNLRTNLLCKYLIPNKIRKMVVVIIGFNFEM